MTEPGGEPEKLRTRDELLGVPRAMARSHYRTQQEQYTALAKGGGVFSRAARYLKIRWVAWVWHYVKSRFGGKYRFGTYPAGSTGIHDLSGPESGSLVKISLTGDWGTGTEDAHKIGELINQGQPDFTVHLGDVYYVGTKQEINENFLGQRVQWPNGKRGTFALNSNHEMYARGKPYFSHLLPRLGMRSPDGNHLGQHASYFALRNDHWIVIGLDTGYYSVGLPIIEKIAKPSCKLHDDIVRWLRSVVRLNEDDSRGIIVLTHHQYFSQFDSIHERAASQLASMITRPVLWFWGHEHRFALYGKHATPRGRLEVYGRCVGHGGMPIEDIADQPKKDSKHQVGLVFYDARTQRDVGLKRTPIGYNGFANLLFEGKTLTVDYRDSENETLVRERWRVGHGGKLEGVSIEQLVEHEDLKLHAPSLSEAID